MTRSQPDGTTDFHKDIPAGLAEADGVRVEMEDGYWFEGEVEEVEGYVEIDTTNRPRKSPLPQPDRDGEYRPYFVGISRQLYRDDDGEPVINAIKDDGDWCFRFSDPDAPLKAEVVYIDWDTGEWPAVEMGEIETFEKLD